MEFSLSANGVEGATAEVPDGIFSNQGVEWPLQGCNQNVKSATDRKIFSEQLGTNKSDEDGDTDEVCPASQHDATRRALLLTRLLRTQREQMACARAGDEWTRGREFGMRSSHKRHTEHKPHAHTLGMRSEMLGVNNKHARTAGNHWVRHNLPARTEHGVADHEYEPCPCEHTIDADAR